MPSLPISRKPGKLVVDANPILSALLDGKAKRLFSESGHHRICRCRLSHRRSEALPPQGGRKTWRESGLSCLCIGSVTAHHLLSKIYRRSLKTARIQRAHRDQDDVEALALALKRPPWTNDKNFGVTSVQTLTTAELSAIYFPRSA